MAPKSVSGRVVKTVKSLVAAVDLEDHLGAVALPIQLRCISLTLSGQSSSSRSSSRRSA